MKVTVIVRPKDGILDPQGDAIARSLSSLGFPVDGVRAGKVFDLELAVDAAADADRVGREAAEQLLANALIEHFDVVVV